jgi:hypothetical protein
MVLCRSYLHLNRGLEFFLYSGRSYFLYFPTDDRQTVIQNLKRLDLRQLKILQTGSPREYVDRFTEQWHQGAISNYQYLMYLNFLAGRSFNDLTQYPVFPWILTNYTSQTLDLDDPNNYRDLSRPVGCFNADRIKGIEDKLAQLPEDDVTSRCHYMAHYSNPFYVLLILVRLEPFTSLHIEICDKKFDKPDRMFWSIPRSFQAVCSLAPDFRELIPEFFTLPEFLVNENGFDLGISENGGSVVLPPWADGSAHNFIDLHRQALESPFVSAHLHGWINLIFGFQQTGRAAVEARNTFNPDCYPSAVTKAVLNEPSELARVQSIANTVGVIPKQIFQQPHPKRTFVPRSHNLEGCQLETVFSLGSTPRFLFAMGASLCVLNRDCSLSALPLMKFIKHGQPLLASPLGSIRDFLVLPTTEGETPSKSFAFILDSCYFVSSSLWDNSFHSFKIDSNTITHCNSHRQKFSLLSTLHYAGGSRLLTSWRDSSLTLWNLSRSQPGEKPLYRATPHLSTIVDLDVNPTLRLIASLDKTRKCVFSSLDTGRFVRAFEVDGQDLLARVVLFSAGFVAIVSEVKRTEGVRSTIRLFGIDTRQICRREIEGAVSIAGKAELDFGMNVLMLGFVSGNFRVLKIPMLETVVDRSCEKEIVSVGYSSSCHAFLVSVVGGDILLGVL